MEAMYQRKRTEELKEEEKWKEEEKSKGEEMWKEEMWKAKVGEIGGNRREKEWVERRVGRSLRRLWRRRIQWERERDRPLCGVTNRH
jgi:hypothetical protein